MAFKQYIIWANTCVLVLGCDFSFRVCITCKAKGLGSICCGLFPVFGRSRARACEGLPKKIGVMDPRAFSEFCQDRSILE